MTPLLSKGPCMGLLRFELRLRRPERRRISRLPYNPLSLIWSKNINEFLVRQEHPATTVTLHTLIIEHHLWVFSGTYPVFILIPVFGYHCATREASYGYHRSPQLPVGFLSSRARSSAAKFLRFFLSVVVDEKSTVLFEEKIFHTQIVRPID